jgi:ubiquinone/menaquinone biosynthesis C-methylase UbiE
MGLYGTYIFPRLMDWFMSGAEFQRLRSDLLKDVAGEVLEIGFGTGLNLRHYPRGVARLAVADPARFLPRVVAQRIAAASFPIETHQGTAEALPFAARRFDWVISTWTLCSIAEPIQALKEIRRVLRPEGGFLFLEHGRSRDHRIAAWQDRLNPIQNIIGCGCNLNRQIDQLIEQSGLKITRLDRFDMEAVPRIGGAMYRGCADPDC